MAVALGTWAASVAAYVSSGYNWGVKKVPFYVNPSNRYVSQANAIGRDKGRRPVWTAIECERSAFVCSGTTNGSSAALNYKNEVFSGRMRREPRTDVLVGQQRAILSMRTSCSTRIMGS